MMGYGGMGYGGAGYGGVGYGGFGGFAVFILALAIVVALVYFRRRTGHGGRWFTATPPGRDESTIAAHPTYRTHAATSPEDEAMAALAARLASGDITPQDYSDRVATLRTVRDQGIDPTAGMPYLGPEDPPEANPRVA